MSGMDLAHMFPLLSRELIEQANRRRTYIVRFLYTAALFGIGLLIVYGRGGIAVDASTRLGEGRAMFLQLVSLQFYAIYLFLPAMTAGVLTSEKEHDTLTLLLLTTMRPWEILTQKLLSRVIPMLCFVILSFPLMAVAYSYGGVTTVSLYGVMVMLILAVVQVAAVALMCSAWCRGTVEAFIASYVLLGLSWTCFPICTPLHAVVNDLDFTFGEVEVRAILVLLSTGVCLLIARACLFSRAFIPRRNVLLQMFQALDSMFQEMNQVTGGVILVKDGDPFPADKPVAWRETAKKSLGTFRYQFRILVLLELPILFTAQSVNISAIRSGSAVTVLLYIVWVIAMVMICIHAASVVSSERSHQTLDSLLTAPIPGADLMRQKLAGVRRLTGVLLVPFLTIYLFHHWFRDYRTDLTYLGLSLATFAIFVPLMAWTAFWIGLKTRSQMKAALITLTGISTLAGLPRLVEFLAGSLGTTVPAWLNMLLAASPATIIERLEHWHRFQSGADDDIMLQQAIQLSVALVVYAAALWWIRRHCLTRADQLLGRVSEEELPPAASEFTSTTNKAHRLPSPGTT